MEDQIKKRRANIRFSSNFGYISYRTINAAIKALVKEDSSLAEVFERGSQNNSKLIYIATTLELVEMNSILNKFIQKYDQLKFHISIVG